MRIGLFPRRAQAPIAVVLIAAATVAVPGAATAGPADRFYERSFVLAANERCGLFQPQLTAALSASTWQARGAALRAGANDRELAETAARARARAASTACGSADLKTVSGRVENAFSGWSRTARMTFPGDRAGWSADRAAYARPTWRLMQATTTGASPVRFGVVGGIERPDQLAAVVSWRGRSRPTGVRIVLRDRAVAPRPWLARELPPLAQRRAIWAAGVTTADPGLLAQGRETGQAWVFPAQAADALAALDPREIFTVEFVFRDGSVARSTFETGDFAAGRAFLSMGQV
ncbi:hypothetical protein [Brevundimonas sp.]|jgi:hypothetical protein|uniref:hypothetical protein n=1 Tax=Brevundimonas sp. TaxID=1871086 RepID=UPI0037BFA054